MRKWSLILLTVLSSLVIASNRVNADSQTELKLDGQFNDWEQINKTPVGYYHMGNWALAVSNDSI